MAKRSKTLNGSGLELAEIEPLTRNQLIAFESDKNLVCMVVQAQEKLSFHVILHLMI